MFIREVRKKNKGSRKVFVYHRLIESYRTPKGPRQRVVLDLGKLALPKDQWKSLANRIEQIVAGQQILVPVSGHVEALAHHYADIIIKNSLSLSQEHLSKEQSYQPVDVNALSHSLMPGLSDLNRKEGRFIFVDAQSQPFINEIFSKL